MAVRMFHDIGDVLLTSDSLAELPEAAATLVSHLQACGWAVNADKIQGTGMSVKFLGVVFWLRQRLYQNL